MAGVHDMLCPGTSETPVGASIARDLLFFDLKAAGKEFREQRSLLQTHAGPRQVTDKSLTGPQQVTDE
jgi:hypothetical protein